MPTGFFVHPNGYGFADDILLLRKAPHAAGVALATIVAHHKIVTLGNGIDGCIVQIPAIAFHLDNGLGISAAQNLAVLDCFAAASDGHLEIGDPAAYHRLAVDMQYADNHLDAITG